MKHRFTRITTPVILGVVFGFFYGCSSLLQNNNDQSSAATQPTVEEIESELSQTRQQLESSPENPDLYYQKGYLLGELARMKEPLQRNPLYSEMNRSLDKALGFYSGSRPGKEKIDELLKVSWSNEHNQGVQIIQTDSTLTSEDYYKAAVHFNNATTILPDSSISYKLEARAYYLNHQPQKAITTLEKARQEIDPLPPSLLEQLAFLYMENDEPEKAVQTYENSESLPGDNLNTIHGLANAYIAAGQHRKAVGLLRNLASEKPDNIIYARSLGIELYFLGNKQLDSLITASPADSSRIDTLLATVDSLYGRAEYHLSRIYKQNPENTDMIQSLADFYQNAAAGLQKSKMAVSPTREQGLESTIREYLNNSIPLLIKLTELQPDTTGHWQTLYNTYRYLGMEEKAREAMKKSGR